MAVRNTRGLYLGIIDQKKIVKVKRQEVESVSEIVARHLISESQQVTAIPNSDKRKKLVRNRWQVAFTLVNNPYLCFGRKMRMKERCILQAQEKSKSKSADTKIASRLL